MRLNRIPKRWIMASEEEVSSRPVMIKGCWISPLHPAIESPIHKWLLNGWLLEAIREFWKRVNGDELWLSQWSWEKIEKKPWPVQRAVYAKATGKSWDWTEIGSTCPSSGAKGGCWDLLCLFEVDTTWRKLSWPFWLRLRPTLGSMWCQARYQKQQANCCQWAISLTSYTCTINLPHSLSKYKVQAEPAGKGRSWSVISRKRLIFTGCNTTT